MTPKNTQTPIASKQRASPGRNKAERFAGIDSQISPKTFRCGATDHELGEQRGRLLAREGTNVNGSISPGRFHASFVMKVVLAHILLRYEFRFEDERAAKWWHWESFKMPYEGTKIVFRKRDLGDGK